jgi:hypothetical protein
MLSLLRPPQCGTEHEVAFMWNFQDRFIELARDTRTRRTHPGPQGISNFEPLGRSLPQQFRFCTSGGREILSFFRWVLL